MTTDATSRQQRARRGRETLLRRHLFVLSVAVLLCGGILAGGEALVSRIVTKQEGEALERAEVSAGVVQQLVLRRIEAADVLHRLAQSWFNLQQQGNVQGAQALEDHLAATANAGSFGFVQVALVAADGWMEWSSISRRESRVFLGDREHFRVHAEGRHGVFISEPVLGRVSNRWTLQLTRPLFRDQGQFGGVVVVSLDLYNLSDALAELHMADGDRSLLLRDAGRVAAASVDADRRIGRDLLPGDALLRRPTGNVSGAMKRTNPGGLATYTGWHRLPGTNLTAVSVLDAATVAEETSALTSATRLGAFFLALLALGSGLVVVLMRERRAEHERLRLVEQEKTLADETHRLFERRVNSLPAVVFGGIVHADGRLMLAHLSESLTRITGWTREGIGEGGHPWAPIAPEIPLPVHAAFARSVLAEGQGTREFKLRRPDGTSILVREHLRIVERLPDGTAEVAGYLRDITAERDIEMKAEAAGRLATLGEMAAGLAHELNQPLAVMSLAADNGARALQRKGAAAIPDVLERLERIGVQGRRARDIVDHLRVFGRAQEEGEAEPVSLAEAVDGALVLTRAALRDVGIRVERDIPADLPPVMARLIPLEQTIVNLLLNARDAITDAAQHEGRIRISADSTAAGVTLTITDNGGGIPEAVMYRMFEPFYTTKPPGKGTGLGLPICHATMRAFGGGIEAANVAHGACFTLHFRTAPEGATTTADMHEIS